MPVDQYNVTQPEKTVFGRRGTLFRLSRQRDLTDCKHPLLVYPILLHLLHIATDIFRGCFSYDKRKSSPNTETPSVQTDVLLLRTILMRDEHRIFISLIPIVFRGKWHGSTSQCAQEAPLNLRR